MTTNKAEYSSDESSVERRIEDYALIGNTLTAALVGRDGSLDWLCLPRFDSPACFARLLGSRDHGRWLVAPNETVKETTRRYIDDSLILETTFTTEGGRVQIIDFMPVKEDDSSVEVIRIVKGIEGAVTMRLDITLRFDSGSIIPWVRRKPDGLQAIAGPDAVVLHTPLNLKGKDFSTVSEFTVHAGESVPMTLSWFRSNRDLPAQDDPAKALEETEQWWRTWISRSTLKGKWRNAVNRSLITLKGLTYSPTGGIIAAPTTSLPEELAGNRNWDYRYCWLRDATFTLYALLISGYEEEARQWRSWLLRAVAGEPSKIQIMYGLAGERRLQEYEVPWLPGFANSSPVRIGNAAYKQRQMDIYGEIMDTIHVGLSNGINHDHDLWGLQRELMNFLSDGHWADPGSGLWESRAGQQAYTFSRVMTWVAFDRAVKAVERFGLRGPADEWRQRRDEIRKDVLHHGFDQERSCFTQYYGGGTLDAALLLLPLVGFIKADDPRMLGTVKAIEQKLLVDGLVRRYDPDSGTDGLKGGEGAFLVCSFWLADNWAMTGRKKEAEDLFERLLSLRNDVGLLSEEYDPVSKRFLGNFPQAFSHVGLINTASNLAMESGPARHRSETRPARE